MTEPSDGSTARDLGGRLLPPAEDAVDLVEQARVSGALIPAARPEPARVGRFELLHRLGRGGMGEVYVAYDDQLDRRVALKLLLRERADDEHARDRLLREAQVLARLSHPNVVQIHEAGVHEGQVYLAMELVDGSTLRQWLEARPEGAAARPWTEVLPVMIEAGRGLAAAHAAGLTHRDFKPDNVLVGEDGRVRVLDFGLARPGAEPSERSEKEVTASLDEPAIGSPSAPAVRSAGAGSRRGIAQLTEPGRVVGTLAYMSPEQLAARPLDGRTDQFSFCVTLFEALYGERPFRGRTLAAHVVAVTQGAIEEPAARKRVPRWLRKVVRRGLAVRPEDRFPDMDALLRELSRARRRGWVIGSVATVGLVGGPAVAVMLSTTEAPCARADAELAARWDDAARQRAREAFVAAAPSYGADVAARTIATLDAAVEGWRAEQVDACEDTRVRQTHPEALLAGRAACIERNTTLLHALLDALPGADALLVEHAHELVRALPGPVRCQDLDALGPEAPEDPEAVARVREGLAEVEVLRLGGHLAEALAAADARLDDAVATGYGPVHAEALVEAAKSRFVVPRRDEHERASQMLWQAFDLVERYDDRALRVPIWVGLLDLDRDLGHLDRARLWAARADAWLERDDADPGWRLDLAVRRGKLEQVAGDLEASERWLRQGLADAAEAPGSELAQALLLEELGATLRLAARGPEARAAYEAAEQRWRSQLGPRHPYLAQHDYNLGLLLLELGEPVPARERLERAHACWLALHGPRARLVGRAELALADLDQTTGALDDALAHARRGEEILASSSGPEDPVRIEALRLLGLVQFRRGELQAAHDAWTQELAQRLTTHAADHPEVLLTRSNLAEALVGLGRHAEAREAYAGLLPVVRAPERRDPMVLMLVLKGLGLAELGMGRPEAAVPVLREALAIGERVGGLPLEAADLQWALARAEVASGEPVPTARERASAAAAIDDAHGRGDRAREIRAWIAALDRRGP